MAGIGWGVGGVSGSDLGVVKTGESSFGSVIGVEFVSNLFSSLRLSGVGSKTGGVED